MSFADHDIIHLGWYCEADYCDLFAYAEEPIIGIQLEGDFSNVADVVVLVSLILDF